MVVSSRLREATALRPGVEQGEAAGAVGRLHHAGLKQPWPTVAACWSPAMPQIAIGAAEQPGTVGRNRRRSRAPAAAAPPARRRAAAERRPMRRVPMSSSSVRAALVASVACDAPAGQPPQQKRVDRAEGEPARLRAARAPSTLSSSQRDLGGREIWIEQQPGLFRDLASWPAARKRIADSRPCGGPARRSRCGSACR